MSFWDGFKKFAQPYGDDDYDDYDDEVVDYPEEHEEEAEEEPVRRRRRSPFAAAESVSTPEPSTPASTPVTPAASSTGFGGQVINMAANKNQVVLFHAKTFDDAARAADELGQKKAIVLNMENMDKSLTRRVVDFLSGAVYALKGNVRKVAQSTYLFVPQNMEISGDLENVKAETDSYI